MRAKNNYERMIEKMYFKFKRYKIRHKGKDYYIFVPDGIKDNLWIVDWADWWYGTFITGSRHALKILVACFALLGFNPYAIIYLPVGKDKIPKNLAGDRDNGMYDIVFRTNRVHFKDKDWKEIRSKLKKTSPTTYKFKYDKERIKEYFGRKSKDLDNIPSSKILKNAGALSWLAVGTAFFSYPQIYYQRNAADLCDSIQDLHGHYNEKYDMWTCAMTCFCYGGYERSKYTYEKPGLTLNVELYDINEANYFLKEKDYLIERNIK